MSEIRLLIEELRKSLGALGKIEAFLGRVVAGIGDTGRTDEKAVVLAELLAKYYTCLETLFLRVSQWFENSLSAERWHADLLNKMTYDIEGVRAAVIRDETRQVLMELLKFRHFTRYYYDVAYDWDRLDFLLKKYAQVRPMVHEDLNGFLSFLAKLDAVDS